MEGAWSTEMHRAPALMLDSEEIISHPKNMQYASVMSLTRAVGLSKIH